MKNFLLKTCLTILGLLVGVGTLWAAADYTLTPTAGSNNSYTGNCDVTIDGITWNVTGNAQQTPWRLGGKSISNVDRIVYSKTAYTSAVNKIDLTVGAASGITVNSLKLVYSTNSDFSNSSEISKSFAANSTISFEADFPANAYYKFVFNITVSGTSNKFLEFSKVEFYNATGGSIPSPEISSITVKNTPSKTSYIEGETFDPTGLAITKHMSDNTSEDVAYNEKTKSDFSFNPDLESALKSTDNNVIIKYGGKTVNLSISVAPFTPTAGTYNIIPNNNFWGTNYDGAVTGVSANKFSLNATLYGIILELNNGSSTNAYITDEQTRVYNGYTLSISAPSGFKITDVVFSADGNSWAGVPEPNSGTMIDTKTWKGTAGAVTITFKGTCRITNIKVTYAIDEQPTKELSGIEVTGTPSEFWKGDDFNHDGIIITANWEDGTKSDVTNDCSFTGYDKNSAGEQTVKVSYNGASTSYTITVQTIANSKETAYTATEAKRIIDAGKDLDTEIYVKGIVDEIITPYSSQYGNISFNVSEDGSQTSQQFQFFRNYKDANKVLWTSANEVPNIGDFVIGYGKVKLYSQIYEFTEGNYIVELQRAESKKYTIKIADDIANGTVTADETEAEEGATITLTATPATGYEFTSWNVTNASTSEAITVTDNKFTMPASDVTVSATFTEVQQGGGDEPAGRPENEIFYESFDTNNGTGGNDNQWSGSIASSNIKQDNEGWIFESGSGADKCAKFGTGSKLGTATTPALGQACSATLTFKAAAWNGNSENTTLKLSVVDGGTISPATVTLTKGGWSTYTVTLTDLTADSKIKFEGNVASNSRFFLDEVSVVKTSDVKVLSSISVKTAPSKVVYTEGEIFDPTGLVITADYGTDGTEDVAYAGNESKFTFSPALTAPLATTNATVTITYGGKTTKQTITVNELPKYTVTFDAQAGSCDTESLTESVSGEGITLPSATCYDEEWTFAGWATAACNETTTAPTLYKAGATYKPTTDITLYAVYMTGVPEGETAFNRVTDISELTNGKRVVVVSNATNRVLTLTGSDTHTQENLTSITESEGKYIWTLGLDNDIYTLTDETSGHRILSFQSTPNPGNNQTGISKWQTSGGYKKEWKISASEVENCWIITNTAEANQGGYAALYLTNPTGSWGALNLQTTSANKDEFAMRIYAEGPSISATYNSNPIEYFNLTISSAGYATYYNAFAYKMPENVVGKIMVCEDGVVKSKLVYEAGDVVPVETPLLLKGNPATYTLVETTEEATKSAEGNLLRGSHVSETTKGGSEQAKYYKFSNGDNGYGWYYGSKDNTTGAPFMNGAHKAYLVVEPDQSMSTRFIAIDSEGVLTDIEGINVDDTNGNVYDLQGRRVQRAGNGIYIKNGKKVIF